MEVKAGKFDCIQVIDDLKHATLLQVLVGKDKDNLMVTSARQSVSSVCEEFGKYVKFVVEVGEHTALPLSSSIGAKNAFASGDCYFVNTNYAYKRCLISRVFWMTCHTHVERLLKTLIYLDA